MAVQTVKDCRNAYREILQGYTYLDEEKLHVKHFKEADLGFIEYVYKRCEKRITEMGVFPLREKLELLNKEEYWTEQDEADYLQASTAVADAYEFSKRLTNSKQIENFKETIKKQEEVYTKIQETRHNLVEPTVETYCNKKINEEYVRKALCVDESLEKCIYSQEEFEELSYREVAEMVKAYNKAMAKFTEDNIKKICVNNFFLNAFLMSENDPVKFFGTSVLDLTVYQLNLFSRGKFYKFILDEGSGPPDSLHEQAAEDIGILVNFYDLEYNRIRNEKERKIGQMKAQAAKQRR